MFTFIKVSVGLRKQQRDKKTRLLTGHAISKVSCLSAIINWDLQTKESVFH